ncbi:hypothetical protein ACTFIW_003387 [Dictyostelium discoideum]
MVSKSDLDSSIVVTNLSSNQIKAAVGKFQNDQVSSFFKIDKDKTESWNRDHEKLHTINIETSNPKFNIKILISAYERILVENYDSTSSILITSFSPKSGEQKSILCSNGSCVGTGLTGTGLTGSLGLIFSI